MAVRRITWRAGVAVLASVLVLAAVARARLGAPGGTRRAGPASPARLAEIDNSFRALEDGERETLKDRWDPDDVVRTVGRDPDRLFAWVRSNTYWIPYRGVLRGPVGVLMDRQGNSLDRALTLATLLDRAGQTVRLAHGTLTRDQALALLPGLVARRAVAFRMPGRNIAHPPLRAMAARYALDGAAIERHLASQQEALARAAAALNARVADQTARLLRAAGTPNHRAEWNRRFDSALSALRDHWWVQRRVDQRWVDLDVMDSIASPSAAIAAVTDTLRLDEVSGASLHQEIAVRVVTEQWSSGRLAEHTALEHVLRPADLIGQSIVLQFWPLTWITDSARGAGPGSDARTTVIDQRLWVATLLVGHDAVATAVVRDDGADPERPEKGGAMSALADGLSHTLGSGEKPELSAVWLEYEIRVPAQAARIVRRTVFDLIGPAARAAPMSPALAVDDASRLTRGLSLTMRTEILPVACELAPQFVRHLVAEGLLGNRALIRAAARGSITLGSAAADSLFAQSSPTVSSLYSLAVARLAWSHDAGRIYIDQPGLLTRHVYPVSAGTRIALRDATDVVANDVGVSLTAADGFRVRLAQGVLDTNAESLLRLGAIVFGNAGDAFAASRAWTTFTPAGGLAPGRTTLPEDVRSRIRDELAAGYIVVAPDAVVTIEPRPFAGWWRIDPSTGHTLGYGDNGWGQEGAEESTLNARATTTSGRFVAMMKRFAGVFATTYMWCLSAVTSHDIKTKGLGPGLKLGIVSSPGECTGDAVAFAFLSVTAELLPLSAEGEGSFAGPPDAPPPKPPNPPDPPPPPPDPPPPPPDPPPPPPDPPPPPPDAPPPEPPADPYGKTHRDPDHTQRDPGCSPETEGPRLPGPALTVEQATAEEYAARVAYEDAKNQAFDATSKHMQYRPEDVPDWNAETEQALGRDADTKLQRAFDEKDAWDAAQEALRRARVRTRAAAGKGGFPPPNPPKPPPAPPGDPACNALGKTIVGGGGIGNDGP